jgi:hypothetical protein
MAMEWLIFSPPAGLAAKLFRKSPTCFGAIFLVSKSCAVSEHDILFWLGEAQGNNLTSEREKKGVSRAQTKGTY